MGANETSDLAVGEPTDKSHPSEPREPASRMHHVLSAEEQRVERRSQYNIYRCHASDRLRSLPRCPAGAATDIAAWMGGVVNPDAKHHFCHRRRDGVTDINVRAAVRL